jgi:lysine-N-methylase
MTDVILPPELNYSCTQCGKSCGLFQEIPIEPRSQERLRGIDFRPLMREAHRHEDPIVPSPTSAKRQMLLQREGHCVFQNDAGLCSVHAAHGEPTKPQTCQDFPFRYVETPAGIYVGLSFACTAVQANTGATVTSQRASLEQGRPLSNARHTSAEMPALTSRHEISWEACLMLDEDLLRILGAGDKPFGLRLVAQSAYLDLLEAFLREVRGDRPLTNSPTATRPGHFAADTNVDDVEALRVLRAKYLDAEGGEPIFRLARKVQGNPTIQRAFIGLITAFRQNLYVSGNKPGRFSTGVRVARHYLLHAARLGRVDLEALERRFDYSDFVRITFSAADPECEELLARYFRHLIFRKDYLLAPNIWLGHRLMLMHYALIRWHAVGLAAKMGRDRVDVEVLREAVGMVERHYVFHTPFGKLFENLPTLGMILDAIVRKPFYSASMTISPMPEKE